MVVKYLAKLLIYLLISEDFLLTTHTTTKQLDSDFEKALCRSGSSSSNSSVCVCIFRPILSHDQKNETTRTSKSGKPKNFFPFFQSREQDLLTSSP